MKVLVVDDSLTMRKINSMSVNTSEVASEIQEATDGEDALGVCGSLKPDIILLDINMPKMDGITFLRTYRKIDKKCQIIMITTEGAKTDVIECLKSGASDYVIKPIERKTLIEKLVKAKDKILKND